MAENFKNSKGMIAKTNETGKLVESAKQLNDKLVSQLNTGFNIRDKKVNTVSIHSLKHL